MIPRAGASCLNNRYTGPFWRRNQCRAGELRMILDRFDALESNRLVQCADIPTALT
jgi:hypothetical protein